MGKVAGFGRRCVWNSGSKYRNVLLCAKRSCNSELRASFRAYLKMC